MKTDYKIDRNKFLDLKEQETIMLYCEKESLFDLTKGRMTWPIRYMLVHLTLNSGLRVSEIANLTISDVHLSMKDSYIRVTNGKGGKNRDVYIDRELVKHLQEFIHRKPNWNQSVKPFSPLFAGQGGKPFTTTALYMSFETAIRYYY